MAARALGAEAAAVPVSVSDAVESTGLRTERTRIGSPWVIAAMKAMEAGGARKVVGWEANGGFLVGSGWESQGLPPLWTRDAVLPLLLALAEGRRVGGLPQLFEALPARFRAAGLLDAVPPEVGHAILDRFSRPGGTRGARFRGRPAWLDQDGTERPPSDHPEAWDALQAELTHAFSAWGVQGIARADWLDGIRVETAAGQVLHVRPSGNAPQLRLYVTASDPSQAETLLQAGLRPGGILEGWVRAVSKRSSPG